MLRQVRVFNWILIMMIAGCATATSGQEEDRVESSKIDNSLAALAEEYNHHLEAGRPPGEFRSRQTHLHISSGYVVVEAVASESGEDLEKQLRGLGCVDTASYGLNVSCRLPLAVIGKLQSLSSLRYARASIETTR